MQEFIKFANENPTCHLATVMTVSPRQGAGILVRRCDRFLFQTASFKDLYGQLKEKPEGGGLFLQQGAMKMMRVAGEIEFVDDRASRQRS
jgi:uncharacterized pyridoxamine 5'-phosphate oxidase family protein